MFRGVENTKLTKAEQLPT